MLPCNSPELAKKHKRKLPRVWCFQQHPKKKTYSSQTHHPKIVPHIVPEHLISISLDIVVAQTFQKKISWKSSQQITPKTSPKDCQILNHYPIRKSLSRNLSTQTSAIPNASIPPQVRKPALNKKISLPSGLWKAIKHTARGFEVPEHKCSES